MPRMGSDQVRALLRRECEAAGGQAAWATSHGISAGYVSDVLSERREPGGRILAALGLVRVVDYQRESMGKKT